MSKQGKFIIGAGISGLIYHFYNPEFRIISKDVGGKLFNSYLTPTIFLHDCLETRKLLTDLDFNIQPRKHQICYFYKSTLLKDIPLKVKAKMVRKKLTPWDEQNKKHSQASVIDLTLSTNRNFIPTFETDADDILHALSSNIDVIDEEVLKITSNTITTNKNSYLYSQLVSTIPAPLFWNMYGIRKSFKSFPQTFILTDQPPIVGDQEVWDLIYFVDSAIPFTRVNKYKQTYLYEFTGVVSIDDARLLFPKETKILNHFIDYSGIVISDKDNFPPQNVTFVGRFATWNHSDKIQDAIRKSCEHNFTFNDKITSDSLKSTTHKKEKYAT